MVRVHHNRFFDAVSLVADKFDKGYLVLSGAIFHDDKHNKRMRFWELTFQYHDPAMFSDDASKEYRQIVNFYDLGALTNHSYQPFFNLNGAMQAIVIGDNFIRQRDDLRSGYLRDVLHLDDTSRFTWWYLEYACKNREGKSFNLSIHVDIDSWMIFDVITTHKAAGAV